MSFSYILASMYGSRKKLDRLQAKFKANSWHCGDIRTSFSKPEHSIDFLSFGKGNFMKLV